MRRLGAILAATAIALTSAAVAQPGTGAAMGDRPMERHQRMMDQLNLTEKQRDQIEKLRLEHQKAATEMHAKIRIARLELRELFLADKLDRGAIEKKTDAITDLQRKAKTQLLDHLFAVYDILNPEQQKIWKGHAGMMGMGPRGRMHQRGGGMRPGMGYNMNDGDDEMVGSGFGMLDGPPWLDLAPEDETPEPPVETH
jgi:Spy/CpxP family protein refolding chaperone